MAEGVAGGSPMFHVKHSLCGTSPGCDELESWLTAGCAPPWWGCEGSPLVRTACRRRSSATALLHAGRPRRSWARLGTMLSTGLIVPNADRPVITLSGPALFARIRSRSDRPPIPESSWSVRMFHVKHSSRRHQEIQLITRANTRSTNGNPPSSRAAVSRQLTTARNPGSGARLVEYPSGIVYMGIRPTRSCAGSADLVGVPPPTTGVWPP